MDMSNSTQAGVQNSNQNSVHEKGKNMEKENGDLKSDWMRKNIIHKINNISARDVRIVYYFLIGLLNGGEKGK